MSDFAWVPVVTFAARFDDGSPASIVGERTYKDTRRYGAQGGDAFGPWRFLVDGELVEQISRTEYRTADGERLLTDDPTAPEPLRPQKFPRAAGQ